MLAQLFEKTTDVLQPNELPADVPQAALTITLKEASYVHRSYPQLAEVFGRQNAGVPAAVLAELHLIAFVDPSRENYGALTSRQEDHRNLSLAI